jgi:hypothetical protein
LSYVYLRLIELCISTSDSTQQNLPEEADGHSSGQQLTFPKYNSGDHSSRPLDDEDTDFDYQLNF